MFPLTKKSAKIRGYVLISVSDKPPEVIGINYISSGNVETVCLLTHDAAPKTEDDHNMSFTRGRKQDRIKRCK